jgi:hypothetical protein
MNEIRNIHDEPVSLERWNVKTEAAQEVYMALQRLRYGHGRCINIDVVKNAVMMSKKDFGNALLALEREAGIITIDYKDGTISLVY